MSRLNFWCPADLVDLIRQRSRHGEVSEAIRESLSRYYVLLDWERRNLQGVFVPAELSLLADISNGSAYTGGHLPLGLLANAEDTGAETYTRWGVDRSSLLTKLRALTPTQEAALVDAIERFWEAVSSKPSLTQPDPGNLLG